MINKFVTNCDCCADSILHKCPECKDGNIIKVVFNDGNSIYSCSNYPFCWHAYATCLICESVMNRISVKNSNVYLCQNLECEKSTAKRFPKLVGGYQVKRCKEDYGYLVRRIGPNGPFWGCSNYRYGDCNTYEDYADDDYCPKCISESCKECVELGKPGYFLREFNYKKNEYDWKCSHSLTCK